MSVDRSVHVLAWVECHSRECRQVGPWLKSVAVSEFLQSPVVIQVYRNSVKTSELECRYEMKLDIIGRHVPVFQHKTPSF